MTRSAFAALALALVAAPAHADDALTSQDIFGPPKPYAIESVRTRFTHYSQQGHGFQSQAGGIPGSESLTVEQPQVEVVARQGERITHHILVPVDVITAASPDAIDAVNGVDAVSGPSRVNWAVALEVASTYRATRATSVGVHGGFHIEAPFRSWDLGVALARSFADDNATLAVSVNQYFDWLDKFDIHGNRLLRVGRSSTNLNLGLTQLLSPTTSGHLDYGVTLQSGTLGNTWNAVPARGGGWEAEVLPTFRQRHAFVGRLVQGLPWRGALHLYYRFYVDDWGLVGHSAEAQLYQRILPWLYVRAVYRVHQQSGVSFFTTLAGDLDLPRTADSDLARFVAHTFGGAVTVALHTLPRLSELFAELGYERYLRTNDLRMNIFSGAFGVRF